MKNLGLSPLIKSGMVIQRDKSFPVWTSEKAGISFLGKTYESKQANGKWLITLDPVQTGGPYSLEITGGDASITIDDIYSGDLWICAGQSNMEMQMSRLCDDYGEEWDLKEYPIIRQFNSPREWDFRAPREDLTGGNWITVSKDILHEFSATAWFFAKNLYEKYKETEGRTVPIGLINTSWGGTPLESWMSRDSLAAYPKIIADGSQYADSAKVEEIAQRTAYAILEWETNLKNEDVGYPLEWQNPQTDISSWSEMVLPGDFANADSSDKESLKNFCGSIWLAKDFYLASNFIESQAKSGAKAWLGTIIDADTVYINGTETGNTGYRYPPRKYVPHGLLKEGENRIVIRVTCNNGQGGITCNKPFLIFTDNESLELSGIWKYKVGAKAPVRPEEFFFHYQPTGNFNAMIAPLLKFPLKGVIWYQGESNEGRPHEYADLFKRMITDWREKNANAAASAAQLPFFFVQLPIWKEISDNDENDSWALMREAQARALSLPATGMAAALELGEWNDLHPVNKKDVGYRLFLAAEKYFFGTDNSSPGPMVNRSELKGGNFFVYFNNCGKGLVIKGGEDTAFVSVVDGNGAYTRLPAVIEGTDCLSIDLSSVKNPKKILYAWANNPRDRQLYNSEGLPVLPFKIEL